MAKFEDCGKLLRRTGPFATDEFDPSYPYLDILNQVPILVVGAGGLGCELLKDLALLGFGNIHVIDMDTIDLSNLNRQFLFRPPDVGKPKAEVAAAFINKRVKGCTVTPHFGAVQDKDRAFYDQFPLIICGLDSIKARRWMNSLVHDMLKYDDEGKLDPSSVKPMIDGGTEGFQGTARVIKPGTSPCVECLLWLYPPQVTFPACTLANRPRLPEHCIVYTKQVTWKKEEPFGDASVDGDNPEHIKWICKKSLERAEEFGIRGVNYRLTQGVVKNIIPAVASTNAVISAACAHEAFKVLTGCNGEMQNYLQYSQNEGVFGDVKSFWRDETCIVCSGTPRPFECTPSTPFSDLVQAIAKELDLTLVVDEDTDDDGEVIATRVIKAPGLACYHSKFQPTGMKNLFMSNAKEGSPFDMNNKANLGKTLEELGLEDGMDINGTDPALNSFRARLKFTA